jgi:hypothetical protein
MRHRTTEPIDLDDQPPIRCLEERGTKETSVEEDAMHAIGMVLAGLGGMLERKSIATTHELSEMLGGLAMLCVEHGEERRGAYIGTWAHMVRAAALGAERQDHMN